MEQQTSVTVPSPVGLYPGAPLRAFHGMAEILTFNEIGHVERERVHLQSPLYPGRSTLLYPFSPVIMDDALPLTDRIEWRSHVRMVLLLIKQSRCVKGAAK
jgi:hypothetical protein